MFSEWSEQTILFGEIPRVLKESKYHNVFKAINYLYEVFT